MRPTDVVGDNAHITAVRRDVENINAVMAAVAQHSVLATIVAVIVAAAVLFVVVRVAQVRAEDRVWKAQQSAAAAEWAAEAARRNAEWAAIDAEQAAAADKRRQENAANAAAYAAEQIASLRNKAVVAIRWRNGLLASKEAMTAQRYADWSAEVSAAHKAVKTAIEKLVEFPTNDNWRGSDVDESWLCQNFGPRV